MIHIFSHTCFEHVAVIGRGGAESDHFHVASDLRQVEAAVLRLIDDLELSRQEEMSNPKPSSIIKLDKGGVIKIIRE